MNRIRSMSKTFVWCRTVRSFNWPGYWLFTCICCIQMFVILCIGVKESPAVKSRKTLSDKGKTPATISKQHMEEGDWPIVC